MEFDWREALETVQGLIDGTIAAAPAIALAFVVFLAFVVVGKGVRGLVRRVVTRRRRHRNLGLVLGRLSQAALVLLGLLVGLAIALPSFQPADVIALLGIGSVAVGFAFRDILQNFLAGILILLTEPFRIDDQIVFKEFEGTVEDIQMRATTIRTYDRRRVVIPNAELFTNAVTVNTAFELRRSEYDLGIGYGDDVDRTRELALEAVRDVDGVAGDPAPDVRVMELADSSVVLRVRWWTGSRRPDVLEVQDRVLSAIKRHLTENGVDLPFPTHQILLHDQTEETDGDRSRQREGWPAGKGERPRPRTIAAVVREALESRTPGADGAPQAEPR